MEFKTQKGYLVLADISGYTFFLANTELEHANIVISYLLETIIQKMGDTLKIAKLEGDAVFAYVEEGQLPDGESLLALIDQTYLAFRTQAKDMYDGSDCPCRACRTIPALDLKFMVHHGDFTLQQIAGIEDLRGSDVNLVHRLLKNGVSEATGWKAYTLLTQQSVIAAHANKEGFIQQKESYEHLGDVQTYVVDMHVRYDAIKNS